MSKSYKQVAPNGADLLFADVKGYEPFRPGVYILLISKELSLRGPDALSLTPYTFFKVEDIGVEPMTLCVQGRCSSQLS
jgi:hypothetical protein